MSFEEHNCSNNDGGPLSICFYRCPTSKSICHAKLAFGPIRPEICGDVHQHCIPRIPRCAHVLKEVLKRYTERHWGNGYAIGIVNLEKTINLPSFNNEKNMLNFWFTFTVKPDNMDTTEGWNITSNKKKKTIKCYMKWDKNMLQNRKVPNFHFEWKKMDLLLYFVTNCWKIETHFEFSNFLS